jgi:tRNA(Ile)-lysidine synthase
VHQLAQRVLSGIRRQDLLRAGDRVGVAVSGGIDSVALLRLLLEFRGELGIVLSVVHFNHKLRGAESDADEQFVAGLAREHDLELYVDCGNVAAHAREEGVSVEAAARELRYGFFRRLLGAAESKSPLLPKPGRSGAPTESKRPTLSLQKAQGQGQGNLREGRGNQSRLDKIATGHTLDDQAETVLMRMIRGAGMRGLGGIYLRIPVEDDDGEVCGEIVRPMLVVRRRELEQYLRDIGQVWREDSTNADSALTRNRVRKLLVPLLEKEFNPAVAENLAELAEIARGEEDYWENEIAGWMGTAVHWSEPEWARAAASGARLVQIGPTVKSEPQGLKPLAPKDPSERGPEGPLSHESRIVRGGAQGGLPVHEGARFPDSHAPVRNEASRTSYSSDLQSRIASAPWLVMNASVDRLWFLAEPIAVQRRLVKAIGEQAGIPLEFKHVEEILRFAADNASAGKELSLPLGWKARRDPDEIVFLTPNLREPVARQDYEYELPIPGTIVVNEIGTQIETQRISVDAAAGYNPEQLLDAESLPGPLRVRNWRPGDRFWPAHTKSPKKVKELLQERHVAQPERGLWPVVVSGDEVVWVRGFPSPAKLRARPGRVAILIIERPIAEDPTA